MIYINIILGIILIIITIFIQAYVTRIVMGVISRLKDPSHGRHILKDTPFFIAIVLLLITAVIIESMVWAVAYYTTSALDSFHTALYFSIVTFTTLGYGDVTLSESWQLLGAFESANGIIIFGWITAMVVTMVQKIYTKHHE